MSDEKADKKRKLGSASAAAAGVGAAAGAGGLLFGEPAEAAEGDGSGAVDAALAADGIGATTAIDRDAVVEFSNVDLDDIDELTGAAEPSAALLADVEPDVSSSEGAEDDTFRLDGLVESDPTADLFEDGADLDLGEDGLTETMPEFGAVDEPEDDFDDDLG